MKQVIIKNEFATNSRNIYLREWCNTYRGRTARIGEVLFGHLPSKGNSTCHYKYGRCYITDSLWDKIVAAISIVETEELRAKKMVPYKHAGSSFKHSMAYIILGRYRSYFKRHPEHKHEFENIIGRPDISLGKLSRADKDAIVEHFDRFIESKSHPQDIKAILDDWLQTDKNAKLRLANVFYSYNYAKNKELVGYQFTNLTNRISNNKTPRIQQIERMRTIISRVDKMIESEHPFYIAAKEARQ